MIRLPNSAQLAELARPVWRDYGHILPGVRCQVRGLTSMDLDAARRRAQGVIRRMASAADDLETTLADYGLGGEDASGARFNPADPDQAGRVGMLIGSVEVVLEGLVAWEGLSLDGESVAPINRQTLAVALLHDGLERRLMADISALSDRILAEGKPLGASPRGSSGRTAQAPTQGTAAKAAGRRTSRARKGAGAATDSSAPK